MKFAILTCTKTTTRILFWVSRKQTRTISMTFLKNILKKRFVKSMAIWRTWAHKAEKRSNAFSDDTEEINA